jgi:hypothetical protein
MGPYRAPIGAAMWWFVNIVFAARYKLKPKRFSRGELSENRVDERCQHRSL